MLTGSSTGHGPRRGSRRIAVVAVVGGLLATLLPLAAGTALAWSSPTITPVCSDTADSFNWTLTLTKEDDELYQLSSNGQDWGPILAGVVGDQPITTTYSHVYFRWANDHESGQADAVNNLPLCTYSLRLHKVAMDGDAQVGLAGAGFTLEQDGKPVTDELITPAGGWLSFTGLHKGTYTIVETTVPDGYLAVADREVSVPSEVAIVLVDEAIPPETTVTFLKEVDNTAGGTLTPADFPMTLTGDATYTGHDGDTVTIVPGTYTLTEVQQPDYVSEFGGGCYQTNADVALRTKKVVTVDPTFTFAAGEHWVCGFRNTYVAPEESTSPSPSGSGGVGGETGRPAVTPPTTSVVADSTGMSSATIWILLVAIGLLLVSILFVSPSPKTGRRR